MIYYRYEGSSGAHQAMEGAWLSERFAPENFIHLHEFREIKTTPAGCWIDVYGERRFILNKATKRYAYPTKQLALQSFIARKARQASILAAQLDNVRALLKLAQDYDPCPPPLLLSAPQT